MHAQEAVHRTLARAVPFPTGHRSHDSAELLEFVRTHEGTEDPARKGGTPSDRRISKFVREKKKRGSTSACADKKKRTMV